MSEYNYGPLEHELAGGQCADECQFGDHDEPPVPRAGERDEWQVRQTSPGESRSVFDNQKRLIANVINGGLAQQIVTDHNQHATLVEQRDRLFMAAQFLLAMNATNYDRDAMRNEGGFDALQKAVDYAIEQSRNSVTTIEREGV